MEEIENKTMKDFEKFYQNLNLNRSRNISLFEGVKQNYELEKQQITISSIIKLRITVRILSYVVFLF